MRYATLRIDGLQNSHDGVSHNLEIDHGGPCCHLHKCNAA